MERLLRVFPACLLVIYLGRTMVLGPQPVDAAILLVLSAFCGFVIFKTDEKTIKELKSSIDQAKLQLDDLKKGSDDLKNHVSSLKLGMSIRTNTGNSPGQR